MSQVPVADPENPMGAIICGHLIEGRKEENILFNDALNTFYLRLYGVGHMVKDLIERCGCYIYIYIVEEGLDGHGLLLLRVSRVMRSSDNYVLLIWH